MVDDFLTLLLTLAGNLIQVFGQGRIPFILIKILVLELPSQ